MKKTKKIKSENIQPFNPNDPKIVVSIRELKDLSKYLRELSEKVDYLLSNIKEIKNK